MNFLEEKIVKEGVVKKGNILKVDSFLNHQMDVKLFRQMGEEFKKRFADTGKGQPQPQSTDFPLHTTFLQVTTAKIDDTEYSIFCVQFQDAAA